jgi:hypothetical protein
LVPTIASKILVASFPKSFCLHGIRCLQTRLGYAGQRSAEAKASDSGAGLAKQVVEASTTGGGTDRDRSTIGGDIEAHSCSAAKPAGEIEPAGDPCNAGRGERPRKLVLARASQTRRVNGHMPFAVLRRARGVTIKQIGHSLPC